jgi:hypothetical protein
VSSGFRDIERSLARQSAAGIVGGPLVICRGSDNIAHIAKCVGDRGEKNIVPGPRHPALRTQQRSLQ